MSITFRATFRADTSFPYLKIANEHSQTYGDVIRHAEWFDQKRCAHLADAPLSDPPPLFDENSVVSVTIILAVLDEHERRTSRNWTEDASHENGNYECRCWECDQMFIGHKHRVVCKLCSNLLAHAADVTITKGA